MNKRLNKEEFIELIKSIDLDKEDFVILSSGALLMRGIMDSAGDLDIAVTKKGFEKLNNKFDLESKGNGFYKVNDQVECIIDSKKNSRELVGNYYVQDIYAYFSYLKTSKREKDKLRIPLVLDYIKNSVKYKSIEEQSKIIIKILKQNKDLMKVLNYIEKLRLPNFYIAAGSIFQTIWNFLDNKPLNDSIKDIDIIYYNQEDLSKEKDLEIYNKVKKYCEKNNLSYDIDVSNEARMHLWKEEVEHKKIKPYLNSEDAINRWIATTHAIGITKNNRNIYIYAPYGLSDIFSKTIRPIKHEGNNKELYDKKVKSWTSRFDNLNVVEW